MANKIEILVEVDPTGRGAGAIKSITSNVDSLGKTAAKVGTEGRQAISGFARELGAGFLPTSFAGFAAATAGGISLIGKAAIDASLDAANAQRVLRSDAEQAKIEFTAAQAEARKFGDDLAISNTEAEVSFARFIRVVKAAGLTENLSKYRKNFEDLAAAYGLQSSEIETLTSQLLSGQDEALNRLGIADPSQLYKRYAEQIGKAVDQLTQEEQVRARLLAVTEKGEQFAGTAQERLTQETGQWALLAKNIADATRELGDYLNKKTPVGDIPFLLRNASKLTDPAAFLVEYDNQLKAAAAARDAQAKAKAQRDFDEQSQKRQDSLGLPGALRNPFGSFQSRITLLGREDATKERENFVNQYTGIFKDPRLSSTTAIFAEEQFRQIKGIFDPEKAQEIEANFAKFWDKYAKVALGALKTAREAAEKNLSRLAYFSTGEANPFVKILVDADERAKELERTFGVLGDKVVSELQKAENAYTKQKLLALQLDQTLKASALRREADSLANFSGISGAEQRGLNQIDAQVSAARNIPELLAKAEAILNGLTGEQKGQRDENGKPTSESGQVLRELAVDFNKVNADTYKLLTDIRTDRGSRGEQRVNQALVDFFNSLSPEFQARIANGLGGADQKQVFADAFKGTADSFKEAITQEIEKAKVADAAVQAVREDIAKIEEARRQGLNSRDADARLLATTGELRPEEQTADIRQARIEALRREADRTANSQEDANKALLAATEATTKLTASIDTLAAETRKPENRRLLVEINNRARGDARAELYGSLTDQ